MVTRLRTSTTDPLRIAKVTPRIGRGTIGLTLCPGKRQAVAMTGAWARDLKTDLEAIKVWGATAVVSLITLDEIRDLSVEALGSEVRASGMEWLHLPIHDYDIPDAQFEANWPGASCRLRHLLDADQRVLVHCKGGLGRAGTVAAMLLVDSGAGPAMALHLVREARPGAVETEEQEQYVIAYAVGRERTNVG